MKCACPCSVSLYGFTVMLVQNLYTQCVFVVLQSNDVCDLVFA